MIRKIATSLLGFAVAAGVTVGTAAAADKIKIGVPATLSGPGAALGEMMRDGFLLGLAQYDNKLGGREVEVIIVDDELKPEVAATRVRRLLENDEVDFIVGPTFTNVVIAVAGQVVANDTIMFSPNSGATMYAGAECNPNLFVTAPENTLPAVMVGDWVEAQGYKRAYVITANYQAGKDAVAGFREGFSGEVEEDFVPLGHMDFQANLAKIASFEPDVIYAFLPGGIGVSYIKQFRQSGLADRVPFISTFTVDETSLPAQGDDALGLMGVSVWASDLDNDANRHFVKAFEEAYGYMPSALAMQAYDVAQVLNAALTETGGDTSDLEALRKAIKAAKIDSPRGEFHFNNNGFPVSNFYVVKASKREDGRYLTMFHDVIAEAVPDVHAANCPLP